MANTYLQVKNLDYVIGKKTGRNRGFRILANSRTTWKAC